MHLNVAGWLVAWAIASGAAVAGAAAAAEAAPERASVEDLQYDVRHVASAGAGRCELQDLPAPLDTPLQAVRRSELSSSRPTVHEFRSDSPPRPTFLDQVSYWTTGPPLIA